ncbi:hypothetical protein Cgig2_010081 [Carnegiea gigantea]|uniref:Uncharacterized protein n=1 Tax=Carnegiea gigantea TaxID=171969 RepID=A0A9Q1QLT2_9CARY|nr:hypothetical protein Cgig2_010081 [Carnegiea gigantea]
MVPQTQQLMGTLRTLKVKSVLIGSYYFPTHRLTVECIIVVPATSMIMKGKYKNYIFDMTIKRKQSKLYICIPDEIDRAIVKGIQKIDDQRRSAHTQLEIYLLPKWRIYWYIIAYSMFEHLAGHTYKTDEGVLQWADRGRSKEIHCGCYRWGFNDVRGDVLRRYFSGKGTAPCIYIKGRNQLLQQEIVKNQQKKI